MIDRVPLQYPLYGASFGEAVGRFRRKLTVTSGRASRSEFWWAYLFVSLISAGVGLLIGIVLVGVILAVVVPLAAESGGEPYAGPSARDFGDGLTGPAVGAVIALYVALFALGLVFLLALVPITIRRLHDAGFSGLWALLYLVPVGSYAVLVLCILDSKPEGARFDPPPA